MKKCKGKYIQRERRIYHGDYLDVNIFPVFKKPGKRKKKTNPSSEIQKKLNQTYRENKVTYLINNNFSKKDLEIGLGFDDEHLPETYADVQRIIRNYIRRIKHYISKNDLSELQYL